MATKPENSEGKKAPADVEARQPAAPYAVDAPASSSERLADDQGINRARHIFSRALEVFEDADSAAHWIAQPNRALGGVTPLSLLITDSGYQLVLDTLGRIEFGAIS